MSTEIEALLDCCPQNPICFLPVEFSDDFLNQSSFEDISDEETPSQTSTSKPCLGNLDLLCILEDPIDFETIRVPYPDPFTQRMTKQMQDKGIKYDICRMRREFSKKYSSWEISYTFDDIIENLCTTGLYILYWNGGVHISYVHNQGTCKLLNHQKELKALIIKLAEKYSDVKILCNAVKCQLRRNRSQLRNVNVTVAEIKFLLEYMDKSYFHLGFNIHRCEDCRRQRI